MKNSPTSKKKFLLPSSPAPELLSPAGSFETLMAAIQAGADAVYFGIEQLNMRARAANNFTLKDLSKISKICQKHNLRSYLALNTILYDHDIPLMKKICNAAKKHHISALIASDHATIQYAHSIGLSVHISTQCNITNLDSIKWYAQFADTIVLARELTLQQINHITKQIALQNIRGPNGNLIKIEIFIHGALCVAISGKCYMSLATYNASANRGACLQNCRRSYKVIDEETGDELKIDNKYIMSPKDLCTIGFLDKLLDSGVSVLKIEGRAKGPDYVYTVTKAYREAIDSYYNHTYTPQKIQQWTTQLEKVYNRGFWQAGYYLGKQLGEWSGVYGSKATTEKVIVGYIENYFLKAKIAQIKLDANTVDLNDNILITGPTTGIIETTITSILCENKSIQSAQKLSSITLPLTQKVRKNDKVYKIISRQQSSK
jgi:putative protease